MSEDNKNMELFNAVCKTDPKFTKKQTYGAKLTTINPQYTLRKATEQWGPYGSKWGMREIRYEKVESTESTHLVCMATLFYPGGEFEIAAAAEWNFKGSSDPYKASLTEARSKGLSLLGFESEIYEGMWDDPSYVQEVKSEFSDNSEVVQGAIGYIEGAPDLDALLKARNRVVDLRSSGGINTRERDQLLEIISQQEAQLREKQEQEESEAG